MNSLETKSTKSETQNFTKLEKIKFIVEKEGSTKSDEMISMLEQKSSRAENNISNKIIQRRSKHDLQGRDYLCTMCWKSYLSYAAMYVHLKKKHKITIDGLKTSYCKFKIKIIPLF